MIVFILSLIELYYRHGHQFIYITKYCFYFISRLDICSHICVNVLWFGHWNYDAKTYKQIIEHTRKLIVVLVENEIEIKG